jgi:hypothetical protein
VDRTGIVTVASGSVTVIYSVRVRIFGVPVVFNSISDVPGITDVREDAGNVGGLEGSRTLGDPEISGIPEEGATVI